MFHVDLLGYLAGSFLLMMAFMKSQTHMRMCNIAGNICFVLYGLIAGIMPVLVLNTIIMGMHIWRLTQKPKPFAA